MRFDFKSILKLLLSLAIGLGLIWYIQKGLSQSDKEQIWVSIRQIKIGYVIIVIFLGALACIIRAYRWKMLLSPLGYSPRKSTLISSIFIMYIANLIFPRLGEVLRCSILQKEEAIPLEKSLGTMIIERLVDLVGMAIIALLGIILEYKKFLQVYQSYQSQKGESNYTIYIVGSILFLIILILAWKNEKIRNFVLNKLKGLIDGLKSIFQLEKPILFIAYSIAIYSIYFFTTYLLYFAIQGTESLSVSSTFVVLTAGTLGVGLTQGGIGAFQIFVSEALALYNMPKSISLAYAWASWLIQTLNLVFLGILSWIYLLMRPNDKTNS